MRRRVTALALTVAVVVVIGVVGVSSLLRPQVSHAVTPDLLQVSPMHEPAGDLLRHLADLARDRAEVPVGDETVIRVEAWNMEILDDGESLVTFIVPESIEIVVSRDGSRTQEVRSAGPRTSKGDLLQGPAAPPVGELLWEHSWGPEEYEERFTDPPTDPGAYPQFLSTAVGVEGPWSAPAALREVNGLLLEQRLTPEQEGALLEFLSDLPGLSTIGGVTDRLGREGIMFGALDPGRPDFEEHLIVSPATGQILSTEALYVGHTRTDIDSPSVVSYNAWIREGETQ